MFSSAVLQFLDKMPLFQIVAKIEPPSYLFDAQRSNESQISSSSA